MDELKGGSHDLHGLDLLSGVSSLEGDASDESFNDGARGLLELLLLISSGSVRDVDSASWGINSDVLSEGLVLDLEALIIPLTEEFWGLGELDRA